MKGLHRRRGGSSARLVQGAPGPGRLAALCFEEPLGLLVGLVQGLEGRLRVHQAVLQDRLVLLQEREAAQDADLQQQGGLEGAEDKREGPWSSSGRRRCSSFKEVQ